MKTIVRSLVLCFMFFCLFNSYASNASDDTNLRVVRFGIGVALITTSFVLEWLSQCLRAEEGRLREIERQNSSKDTQKKESLYDAYREDAEASRADDYSAKSYLCAALSKGASIAGGILICIGVNGAQGSPDMSNRQPPINPYYDPNKD